MIIVTISVTKYTRSSSIFLIGLYRKVSDTILNIQNQVSCSTQPLRLSPTPMSDSHVHACTEVRAASIFLIWCVLNEVIHYSLCLFYLIFPPCSCKIPTVGVNVSPHRCTKQSAVVSGHPPPTLIVTAPSRVQRAQHRRGKQGPLTHNHISHLHSHYLISAKQPYEVTRLYITSPFYTWKE